MKILNWITEHELDQPTRRGWIDAANAKRGPKSTASS